MRVGIPGVFTFKRAVISSASSIDRQASSILTTGVVLLRMALANESNSSRIALEEAMNGFSMLNGIVFSNACKAVV